MFRVWYSTSYRQQDELSLDNENVLNEIAVVSERTTIEPKGETMKHPHCEYHNDGERILAPGKFKGEPVFAPYFWELALEGCADEDDGKVYKFRFCFSTDHQDRRLAEDWPTLKTWLGRKRTLRLREDDQGFVHCF